MNRIVLFNDEWGNQSIGLQVNATVVSLEHGGEYLPGEYTVLKVSHPPLWIDLTNDENIPYDWWHFREETPEEHEKWKYVRDHMTARGLIKELRRVKDKDMPVEIEVIDETGFLDDIHYTRDNNRVWLRNIIQQTPAEGAMTVRDTISQLEFFCGRERGVQVYIGVGMDYYRLDYVGIINGKVRLSTNMFPAEGQTVA